ncbi:antibiotic biosynthesis monooxygenase [Brucepastera parasyntrophica]|uniref:antibiotic biosynthesis monooxygenase family protein n=1 Tax=Brucepastera parasyntrophica TaxID=2880008 RepID=UPI00210D8098|nr:antibiotic biosynthesis monooxygenase [Brucepastera parasyntrophica]ULQ58688.1 antibiotic biosynthesis monooxygenase [Brucepastera parasyntrophica]
MVLVIFEVTVKEGCMDDYLAAASKLKEELARANGFIRAERFSSLAAGRKLLSLSEWDNENAVTEWRNQYEHRQEQRQGRDSLFESYTITVASALRTYTDKERHEAPADSDVLYIQ